MILFKFPQVQDISHHNFYKCVFLRTTSLQFCFDVTGHVGAASSPTSHGLRCLETSQPSHGHGFSLRYMITHDIARAIEIIQNFISILSMIHVLESGSRDAVAKMKNHWLLISLIEGNLELEFLACSLLLIFQFL